jgi:transcriptional regulator with XRE-family HTH domain
MKTDPVNRFVVAQIVRHRLQKGITVAELAKGTGIPLGSISCLLTGRYRCSLLNLFKILSHMRVGILDVWPGTFADIPASDFKSIHVAVR